jgi:peptidoglycan hydrolase-like protein with peptidoglycan-binding domain
MSDEPELREGESSEWVQYLQRLLSSQGYWTGGDDGAFTPELTQAVVYVQHSAGISPADGVVRQDTWDALHGIASGGSGGGSSTTVPTQPASEQGSGVPGDGPGVPAFEYTLPTIPIAEAMVVLPQGTVTASLTIRGKVKVTFQQSVQGFTMNVNDGAWKVAASYALDGLNTGLEVGGLGTDAPYIASTWQTEFVKTGVRVTPPNMISYTGNAIIGYDVDTSMGPARVDGQPGFQLDVTVTPNQQPDPEPVTEPEFQYQYEWLAVAGLALVAIVAIAAAPETGGASLALLAI